MRVVSGDVERTTRVEDDEETGRVAWRELLLDPETVGRDRLRVVVTGRTEVVRIDDVGRGLVWRDADDEVTTREGAVTMREGDVLRVLEYEEDDRLNDVVTGRAGVMRYDVLGRGPIVRDAEDDVGELNDREVVVRGDTVRVVTERDEIERDGDTVDDRPNDDVTGRAGVVRNDVLGRGPIVRDVEGDVRELNDRLVVGRVETDREPIDRETVLRGALDLLIVARDEVGRLAELLDRLLPRRDCAKDSVGPDKRTIAATETASAVRWTKRGTAAVICVMARLPV